MIFLSVVYISTALVMAFIVGMIHLYNKHRSLFVTVVVFMVGSILMAMLLFDSPLLFAIELMIEGG